MTSALEQMLDEQDAGALHGAARPAGRVNHLGQSSRPVSEVFAAVSDLPRPAVRSGHLGNWRDIWRGRVGLVDYNRYICRDFALGVPALHAHTFTETRALDDGDLIYLPAGVVGNEGYARLDLYVREGTVFRPLPEDQSACCAFVYVAEEGRMTSLLQRRWAELDGIPGAATLATLLVREEELLRSALEGLLAAAQQPEGGLTLEQVFGSSVSRQGVRGSAPRPSGAGFLVEETWYESSAALVDAAFSALAYGSTERLDVHLDPQPLDDFLPLLSAAAMLVLIAYWDCRSGTGTTRVHAHWGAISMSGYPPLSQGYFGHRATRKAVRLLGENLREVPGLDFDLQFALLPAPLLSLLPPAEFGDDVEAVHTLLGRVLSTPPPGGDPNLTQQVISATVEDWLSTTAGTLSDYYLNRFGLARTVHNGTRVLPTDGAPAELGPLGSLTMQQASMVLGALITHAKTARPGR